MDEQQPVRVDIPGVGPVEFPASMSSDDINAAAKRLHDEANYQPVPTPGRGGVPLETGGPTEDGPVMSGLKHMLEPLAHPQTAGDMAGLLIPSGGAGGVVDRAAQAAQKLPLARIGMGAAGAAYGGATAPDNATPMGVLRRVVTYGTAGAMAPEALKMLPAAAREGIGQLATKVGEMNSPLTVAGREGRAVAASRAFNDLPLAQQMDRLPTDGPIPDTMRTQAPPYQAAASQPSAPVAQAAPAPSGALSPIDKAALVKQGYTPDVIQRIEGQLKPIASHAAPAVEEAAAGPLPNTVDAPLPSHPLTQPRIEQGADVVGRTSGLGKQAVRDATGPVLGEAPGAASPILPRGPSQKIIERLKEMGPQGTGTVPEAERDAYVMRANGDKARAQIKAYLDALRAVGYSGAAGVAARKALTSSMSSDPTPQGPQ